MVFGRIRFETTNKDGNSDQLDHWIKNKENNCVCFAFLCQDLAWCCRYCCGRKKDIPADAFRCSDVCRHADVLCMRSGDDG